MRLAGIFGHHFANQPRTLFILARALSVISLIQVRHLLLLMKSPADRLTPVLDDLARVPCRTAEPLYFD